MAFCGLEAGKNKILGNYKIAPKLVGSFVQNLWA